jgi:Secretion system C-terminal sorting domain
MKRLLLLFIAICIATLANAQLTVDTTYNWQQLIPTILGGNCVQISNVTFNSNQNASARFSGPNNAIGLNNGLLITTGKANLALGPNNSAKTGLDLHRPGDPTLSALSGHDTHDAVILEFDFMSLSDDTLFIKYVFASEEYPEFVGSQYNDIFGFFVWGPNPAGGDYANHNIALIPGTNTPVAINNVNHLSYTNFYVDNTGGAECQYDGFTVPLTASFSVLANQTYHLKIAISDAGDGIYDSGVFLESYPGVWDNIEGNVTHLGQPATDGIVELFGFNIDENAANLVSTEAIDINGNYTFTSIPAGAYIIRGTLDTLTYPNSFPKYYNDAFLWGDADIVALPCDSFTVDMGLMVLNSGTNTISGTILYSSDYLKLTNGGLPYQNAHVFLVNRLNNAVHGFKRTNAKGEYKFENINNGQYAIYVDIPGLYQDFAHEVTVNENENITGQNYFVNDRIYITDTEILSNSVSIYPNPAQNQISFQINLKNDAPITINLCDVTGRRIINLYTGPGQSGVNTMQTDISVIPAGIYFVQMFLGDERHVIKLVKPAN